MITTYFVSYFALFCSLCANLISSLAISIILYSCGGFVDMLNWLVVGL